MPFYVDSCGRWDLDKRSKHGLKLVLKGKHKKRKFTKNERMDISNLTLTPYTKVTTSIRNRINYQDRISNNCDDSDGSDQDSNFTSGILQQLLESPMGCEREGHSSTNCLDTCQFTCSRCGLKWHDECLKQSATKLGMESFTKDKGYCVICVKKLSCFAREEYVPFEDMDLTVMMKELDLN